MINFFKSISLLSIFLFIISCSTIQSTVDSVSDAGSYVYDSIKFWEDDEVIDDSSEAIVIEEAIEVPDYAITNLNEGYSDQTLQQQYVPQNNDYFDPVYRSARQYYYVSPNGSPLPAPPPPPFPQYSIGQNSGPYNEFYSGGESNYENFTNRNIVNSDQFGDLSDISSEPTNLSVEEEMEIFGIENNCIRVAEDYVNGGFRCDDFD